MSENDKSAPSPETGDGKPRDNGRIATDSPLLPEDGAAAAPAEAATEDRTTPAGATPGRSGNGSAGSVSPGNGSAPAGNGSAASSSGSASSGTAATGAGPAGTPSTDAASSGSRAGEPARPVPHPRPEGVAPAAAAAKPAADEDQTDIVSAPPPWRRAPGDEVTERGTRPAPAAPASVDSLLSDAPTAYIDRGKAGLPGAGAGAAASTATREREHVEIPAVASRAPRQALLQVKRFDPWSVLKLALVLAVVLFFIWLVAVGVLYGVLDGMGVWDRLNGTYADLVSGGQQGGGALISAGSVFGIAAVIGAINSLLFAVAMTVGAFVYNVSADLVGGIEVTLSERD
ncbi:hypothetical protein GCM10009836_62920 [Pseudonocardia ailaonensis]|uniref:DUF3566 domain-containing protein n=1 Tax=Pseudonocardia ailaonensis TaxID=367279 RepID=A0ABN2NKJ0_9PSEU